MLKKIRIMFMMILCLSLLTAVSFASSKENNALDQVMRLHGKIVAINNDKIVVEDEQNDQTVALIVRWDTEILNGQNGQDISLNRLNVGDELTAYYSSISTRSLPPQSKAYALVMGSGEHDGVYMCVGEVNKVKNGVKILNSNEDLIVTIPEDVLSDAKKLQTGDKILVWYNFVALSMPGQTTATKAMIL